MALLELEDVGASRGENRVLHGVSLSVEADTIVALMGRNGVGKTTLLETVMNMTDDVSGEITYDGRSIRGLPTEAIANRGITLVPEDRRIFPNLTVGENLEIAARNSPDPVFTLEEAYDLFPILEEKRSASGTSLSGGQQQMLAIARGLVRNTKLLLLDEPMEGLAPNIVSEIETKLDLISAETTVLVVAQNEAILGLCEYAYVLDNGRIVHEGEPDQEDILSKLAL